MYFRYGCFVSFSNLLDLTQEEVLESQATVVQVLSTSEMITGKLDIASHR